jgi:hypothetical protein
MHLACSRTVLYAGQGWLLNSYRPRSTTHCNRCLPQTRPDSSKGLPSAPPVLGHYSSSRSYTARPSPRPSLEFMPQQSHPAPACLHCWMPPSNPSLRHPLIALEDRDPRRFRWSPAASPKAVGRQESSLHGGQVCCCDSWRLDSWLAWNLGPARSASDDGPSCVDAGTHAVYSSCTYAASNELRIHMPERGLGLPSRMCVANNQIQGSSTLGRIISVRWTNVQVVHAHMQPVMSCAFSHGARPWPALAHVCGQLPDTKRHHS